MAFLQAGRIAEPFELNINPDSHNILTSAGFANAVVQTLRLKEGAGCLHAPVCGTWVWMPAGKIKTISESTQFWFLRFIDLSFFAATVTRL